MSHPPHSPHIGDTHAYCDKNLSKVIHTAAPISVYLWCPAQTKQWVEFYQHIHVLSVMFCFHTSKQLHPVTRHVVYRSIRLQLQRFSWLLGNKICPSKSNVTCFHTVDCFSFRWEVIVVLTSTNNATHHSPGPLPGFVWKTKQPYNLHIAIGFSVDP